VISHGVNSERLRTACADLGLILDDVQLQAFAGFEDALYRWNEQKNLTRIPREDCWWKHFLDSILVGIAIQRHCPDALSVVDLGTGPGFPAWPLACAFPTWQVMAVDSNGKMLDFLRTQPLPNLQIHQGRVEDWRRVNHYDVATGRALAPLAVQLEISVPLVTKSGFVVPMRTPHDLLPTAEQAEVIGLTPVIVETLPLVESEVVRVFPVYRRVETTVNRKRRTWAEIKKKPAF
jgi:16S rRNA (guanine527-N7)-methyltransferase